MRTIATYTRLLSRYLRPQWPLLLVLGVLIAAVIGLQLGLPQLIRHFIDLATDGQGGPHLAWMALLYTGAALLLPVVTALARYIGQAVAWTATNEMRLELAAHCLRLELAFHKSYRPGELIERIDGDVGLLTNFFSRFVLDILANLALLAGILVMLLLEDWRIGLVMTAFAVAAAAVPAIIRSLGVPYWVAMRQATSEVYGFTGEVLTATADLRANGAVGYVHRRFHDLLRYWYPIRRRAFLAMFSVGASTVLMFAIGHALAFGVGLLLWERGAITIGTFYLLFHYTELLRRPIDGLRAQLQDLQQAAASIERVSALMARTSAVADGPGAPLPAGALSVAFRGLSFAYEPGEPVLQDLTLDVAPGQVVGLLGRTGSGKSSIARLLLRLQDPTGGAIALGGIDMRLPKLRDLRRRVGLVTQDVQLFRASVRDNVTFFDDTIPDERIVQVLEDVGLRAWLAGLPHGLDTELQAGGSNLSAGEAQLLAMARIFLADPGLVILDEASSRLDPATEQRLEAAITRLLAGRTAVIIAHRLATVERADTIVILERGRIVEQGARMALATDPSSHFAQLLRTGQEELLA